MTLRGKVQGGVVVLEDKGALPEGTEVRVEPIDKRGTLKDLLELAGKAQNLPPDMAENHDHYLHGLPKKS